MSCRGLARRRSGSPPIGGMLRLLRRLSPSGEVLSGKAGKAKLRSEVHRNSDDAFAIVHRRTEHTVSVRFCRAVDIHRHSYGNCLFAALPSREDVISANFSCWRRYRSGNTIGSFDEVSSNTGRITFRNRQSLCHIPLYSFPLVFCLTSIITTL